MPPTSAPFTLASFQRARPNAIRGRLEQALLLAQDTSHDRSHGPVPAAGRSRDQAGLIDIAVAENPGSIHKACGKLMYHYRYHLQNGWPSDGAIIQEIIYYRSIVPCKKWAFFTKSNEECASQLILVQADHYYEAFPTIAKGQKEDEDITGKAGYTDYVGEPQHPETSGAVVQFAFAKFYCYSDMMGVDPRQWSKGGMAGTLPNTQTEPPFWKTRPREQGSRAIVHIWACCADQYQDYFFSNP